MSAFIVVRTTEGRITLNVDHIAKIRPHIEKGSLIHMANILGQQVLFRVSDEIEQIEKMLNTVGCTIAGIDDDDRLFVDLP